MTDREAFKVGFISRCLEAGLTLEQVPGLAKQAADKLASLAGLLGTGLSKTVDLGAGLGNAALGYGLPLALAAPPLLGGMAGYGLAKATDIDDTDIAEIKDRELLDEYKRQTQQLLRRRAGRDYLQARLGGR